MSGGRRGFALLLLLIAVREGTGRAAKVQEPGDLAAGTAQRSGQVTYTPEPAVVPAGKRAMIEVRLRIANGFHINSHRPKGDLLIATAAVWEPGDTRVTVGEVEYPPGAVYRFANDPTETLDVYTGAVVLRVPVTASAGEHALRGSLRYQACDDHACYPVKRLPLTVAFTAR